jgi:hypothetical protein
MLLEHLDTQYKITSIFKPNKPLANVDEALRKLSNDFTMRNQITRVGGPVTSYITRLYISFKFLPSKIYRREVCKNLYCRQKN